MWNNLSSLNYMTVPLALWSTSPKAKKNHKTWAVLKSSAVIKPHCLWIYNFLLKKTCINNSFSSPCNFQKTVSINKLLKCHKNPTRTEERKATHKLRHSISVKSNRILKINKINLILKNFNKIPRKIISKLWPILWNSIKLSKISIWWSMNQKRIPMGDRCTKLRNRLWLIPWSPIKIPLPILRSPIRLNSLWIFPFERKNYSWFLYICKF